MDCPACGTPFRGDPPRCPACAPQTLSGLATCAGGAAAAPLDLVGRELGGYTVHERLARGGMGEVFLATQRALARKVALKVVTPAHEAEARVLARLNHPHILPIHDVFRAAGRVFLALAWMPGSLATVLREDGALPPVQAVRLARETASALHAAAEQGIVHRDVKPGNLLLGEDRSVRLADFGIAGPAGADAAVRGTPAFLAPELWRGEGASVRSDLYALGCTLWAMLTGAPPFPGPTERDWRTQHLREPPPDLRTRCPSASPALAALCARLLAKEPDARPPSARELGEALAALPEARGPAPTEVGRPAPVRPPRRGLWGWLRELFGAARTPGGAALPGREEAVRQLQQAWQADSPAAARAAAAAAVEACPDWAFARLVRGWLRLRAGQAGAAAADCTRGLALAPPTEELAALHRVRSSARLALGDPGAALADAESAVHAAPGRVEPYLLRARCLLETGDRRGALRDCNAALGLEEDAAAALFTRGALYALAGRLERARGDFSRAFTAEPEDPTPRVWYVASGGEPDCLQGVRHGLAWLLLGRVAPEELLSQAAGAGAEGLCVARLHVGWLYLRQGRGAEARALFAACAASPARCFEAAWARAWLAGNGGG